MTVRKGCSDQIRDLRQADPSLTKAEIARRVGCCKATVTQALDRVTQGPRARRYAGKDKSSPVYVPSVRYGVAVDGVTFRAIRDHAAAAGVSFDTIVATLLREDVEAGVLDQYFPKKGGAG